MLEVTQIPAFNDNYLYILQDPKTGLIGLVDPGDPDAIIKALDARGLKADYIFNTHHHDDHTGGNLALKNHYGLKIIGASADRDRLPGLDQGVKDGDTVMLGEQKAKIYATPGHTSEHIVYYFEASNALFSGDTLFSLGCGRLFEGTAKQMWASLEKLRALPDNTALYCAHEYTLSNAKFALSVEPDNQALQARFHEATSLRAQNKPTIPALLGNEKACNPFLRPDSAAIRAHLNMAQADNSTVFGRLRQLKDNF